jgi:hypothetical protein
MIYRGYTIDTGAVSIGGTSATPLLYLSTPSTATTALVRVSALVEAASSPAPPSNGSVYFGLYAVTGSQAGGASVTPTKLSPSGLAAQTTYVSGSTAITGLTQGALSGWSHAVPFTSGASWEDAFENTGVEVWVEASTKLCFYFVAASGAGSGMTARLILETAE